MYDSCIACGKFAPEGRLNWDGEAYVCPACGHRRVITKSDLFVVFGPSGSGKSSLANYITTRSDRPGLIYLDSDILWSLNEHMGDYVNYWMFICACIAQSGHPVVLFGGMEPPGYEEAKERCHFNNIYYLALVSDDEDLGQRLRSRPSNRLSSSPEMIVKMQRWNQSLRSQEPESKWSQWQFDTLDSTGKSLDESASELIGWLRRCLD